MKALVMSARIVYRWRSSGLLVLRLRLLRLTVRRRSTAVLPTNPAVSRRDGCPPSEYGHLAVFGQFSGRLPASSGGPRLQHDRMLPDLLVVPGGEHNAGRGGARRPTARQQRIENA